MSLSQASVDAHACVEFHCEYRTCRGVERSDLRSIRNHDDPVPIDGRFVISN
jgi:hypothetical protein